ncbi:MAG: protein rep, partial [Bacteroidota bacterium]
NTDTSLLHSLLHDTVTDSIPVCACCGKSEHNLPAYDKDALVSMKEHRDMFIGKFSTVKGRDPVGLLGNTTIYSANGISQSVKKGKELTPSEIAEKKYDYKKENIERKKKIGAKEKRVGYCGVRPILKGQQIIDAVLGESGNMYYHGVMRCGSIWFCPDCMYKIMKVRADELYEQLQAYKKADKTVLFITLTLQHNVSDTLENLHKKLLGAFNYANSNGSYKKIKQQYSVEFLRVFEVLYGKNGWHPHLHTVFVGDPEMLNAINVFIKLYERKLLEQGLLVNENTVVVEKWNGKLDDMTDYLFKGMLEKELTGASMKTSKHGKTFFELIDEGNDSAVDEYIRVMKGKHQYYPSKGFFKDIKVMTDEEILKDDKAVKVIFSIPRTTYNDLCRKGIALHLLNEYIYGGRIRAIKLLELYDCDTDFMVDRT